MILARGLPNCVLCRAASAEVAVTESGAELAAEVGFVCPDSITGEIIMSPKHNAHRCRRRATSGSPRWGRRTS